MITDNNFSVSVKIGQNISIGQFVPKYGKYGYLEGIIKTLDFNTSDIVYTSGHSEIYPPDIPVCKIISSKKKIAKSIKSLNPKIKKAIDFAFNRIFKFHSKKKIKNIS